MERIYSLFKTLYSWLTGSSSAEPQNQTEPSESPNTHDIPVTNPPQAQVSTVQEEKRPAKSTEHSHSDHLHVPIECLGTDQIAEVDKINVIVKSSGKNIEVDMFPLENINVLLKEACDRAGKKPEKMCLVFNGTPLDVNKTVSHYGLRGGTVVHLIHQV